MRRLIPVCIILAVALLLPMIAAAQATSISGQVIDPDGKPWADTNVFIQNTSNGQHFQTKTDKNGHYSQLGLSPGPYTITFQSPPDANGQTITYAVKAAFRGSQDNDVSVNFKKLIETSHPETSKKAEEEKNRINNMMTHFQAGIAAMNDSKTLRAQLTTTPDDQKGPVQEKLNSDYKTAIDELQQAQQAASPADVKTLAVIWGNLGQAYDYTGKYDDAINSYQKAIGLQPDVIYYTKMSLDIANQAAAVSQSDPNASAQKLADASAACDKAAALDTTANVGVCYKNIGVILSNKADMKDAIPPLRKATQSNPKDAQAWFLLGSALVATADVKQQGNELVATFPPGTEDALHKCIEADPNGPYASQAKAMLDEMASMSGGEKTTVGSKKK